MDVRKLRLRGLESHAASDGSNVAVEAIVYTAREQHQLVEHVVGDLSLSPLVLSTKWTSTTAPE